MSRKTIVDKRKHKVSIEYKDEEVFFKGDTVGIRLFKRDENDNHILFQLLVEDDGDWFPSNGGVSTYFLDEHFVIIDTVKQWLYMNCEPDGNGGWKFKGGK